MRLFETLGAAYPDTYIVLTLRPIPIKPVRTTQAEILVESGSELGHRLDE
jgi:hypothetical protein